MRTGDRTVCKVTRKWEECLGRAGSEWCDEVCTRAGGRHRKVCPVLSLNNGTHFPLAGPTGKRDPQFRVIPGRAFPDRPEAESVSRSEPLFWDAVSAEPYIKEKDPFAEVLVNSRWRGRESRPRAARTDRCGAYAPCELRWQTLTRLLSSAPSRGSIPCGGCIKEKDPFAEVLVNSRWRGRESNP